MSIEAAVYYIIAYQPLHVYRSSCLSMAMQQKGKVHVRPLWDGVGWREFGRGPGGREREGPKQEIGSWANKVWRHMHAHDSITSCTPIKSHVTTIILLLLCNKWAKMHTCINILSSWRPQGNMHIHVHLHVHTDWYDIIWFATAAWRLPTQSLGLRGLGTGGACPWHGMCIHYTSIAVLCRAVNLI